MICKICLDDNYKFTFIAPCMCSGTNGNVHLHCLSKWLWKSKTTCCPVCKMDFKNKELWGGIVLLSIVSNLILEISNIVIYICKYFTSVEKKTTMVIQYPNLR